MKTSALIGRVSLAVAAVVTIVVFFVTIGRPSPPQPMDPTAEPYAYTTAFDSDTTTLRACVESADVGPPLASCFQVFSSSLQHDLPNLGADTRAALSTTHALSSDAETELPPQSAVGPWFVAIDGLAIDFGTQFVAPVRLDPTP
jgi:hypothetical protein